MTHSSRDALAFFSPSLLGTAALLTSIFLGCHDAPRKNPFDPALTPAVEVTVALDPGTGTAVVDWTPYAGRQPFAEYWILRQGQGLVTVDTLAVIRDLDLTAFTDSLLSPNTAYEYRVSVTNASGYEAVSESMSNSGYRISAVELLDAEADAEAGAVRLRWTRFQGPRFQGYNVERRGSSDDDFVTIAQVESPGDTLFTDTDIAPDVSYIYRIALQAAGQLWISNRSGREQYSLSPVVLLDATAGQQGIILLTWSRFTGPGFESYQIRRRLAESVDEELIGRQTQIQDTSFVDGSALAGGAYVYTVTVQATDEELVSNPLVSSLTLPAVEIANLEMRSATASASLSWTPYEGPRFRSYQVWRRATGFETRMVAEIAEREVTSFVDIGLLGNTEYFYRVVVATTRSEEVASTEVSGTIHALVDSWPLAVDADGFIRLYQEREDRITALAAGEEEVRLLHYDTNGTLLDEQLLLELSAVRIEPRAVATAVDEEGERFLTVGYKNKPTVYGSGFGGERTVRERGTEYKKFLLRFSPQGTLDGRINSPLWQEQQTDLDNQWASLLSFEGSLTLTVGEQPYSLDQEGEAMSRTTLPSLVSEMRVWNRSGGTGTVGICLPQLHQLAVIQQRIQGSLMSWNFPIIGDRVQAPVGSGIGQEPGRFVFPLSFDAGPDERLFVLDAGNDRIQVFDPDRKFVTEWGQRGDGPGEFTFGSAVRTEPEDFSGSVVVDGEGFIYVADVLNQRIQKFAP